MRFRQLILHILQSNLSNFLLYNQPFSRKRIKRQTSCSMLYLSISKIDQIFHSFEICIVGKNFSSSVFLDNLKSYYWFFNKHI